MLVLVVLKPFYLNILFCEAIYGQAGSRVKHAKTKRRFYTCLRSFSTCVQFACSVAARSLVRDMSLGELSELEKKIAARMQSQNLNPYESAPDRAVSADEDDSGSDETDSDTLPIPPAARLGNADW